MPSKIKEMLDFILLSSFYGDKSLLALINDIIRNNLIREKKNEIHNVLYFLLQKDVT